MIEGPEKKERGLVRDFVPAILAIGFVLWAALLILNNCAKG